MTIKILTPDEFNSLQLPIKLTFKIFEACRHFFVNGTALLTAAELCSVKTQRELEELYAAIQIINRYLKQ